MSQHPATIARQRFESKQFAISFPVRAGQSARRLQYHLERHKQPNAAQLAQSIANEADQILDLRDPTLEMYTFAEQLAHKLQQRLDKLTRPGYTLEVAEMEQLIALLKTF